MNTMMKYALTALGVGALAVGVTMTDLLKSCGCAHHAAVTTEDTTVTDVDVTTAEDTAVVEETLTK